MIFGDQKRPGLKGRDELQESSGEGLKVGKDDSREIQGMELVGLSG